MKKPVDSLSESQKACLRLVAKGMTSKEIAQATGLAPQTVDTYLKVAMARLDATSRRDAARKLATQEVSQNLGSRSQAVAEASAHCDELSVAKGRGWIDVVFPPLGGSVNKMSATQRTYAVLKVAVMSAAVVFALTLAVAGVMETFR